jgi:hypothetical protein
MSKQAVALAVVIAVALAMIVAGFTPAVAATLALFAAVPVLAAQPRSAVA